MEQERARKIQEENERSQMAILRLLDELGDLAEGDLTVNATVSEDFTGAIADSVNLRLTNCVSWYLLLTPPLTELPSRLSKHR